MKIIFASNNQGKIQELSHLLQNTEMNIVPQQQLNVREAAENGLTFVENALIKARNAAQVTRLPSIADDSGLVVPFLKGMPGIYSARFAGEKAAAADNNKKLLQAMEKANAKERTAYFYCVLVFMRHALDPAPFICEGIWEGRIANQPQGEQGFGYDPLFYLPGLDKTAAELSLPIKNNISHRSHALRMLLSKLKKNDSFIT